MRGSFNSFENERPGEDGIRLSPVLKIFVVI